MKSRTIIISAVIGVFVIGLLVYVWKKNTTTVPAYHDFATTTPAQINASPVTVQSKQINTIGPNATYDVTASYPVVSGSGADTKINAALYATVQGDVSDFISNIESNTDEMSPTMVKDQSTLTIDYTAYSAVSGIVTMLITQNFYFAGAAHPGGQIDGYTFDVKSGKILKLGDLLTGNYLQILSDYSKNALVQKLGEYALTSQIEEGTKPIEDNFTVFVPETDGLHVTFNQDQVAPYAAGVEEIVVPYSVLKAVINPNGLFKNFAQ